MKINLNQIMRQARQAAIADRNAADLAAYTSAHQSPDPHAICAEYRHAVVAARYNLRAANDAALAAERADIDAISHATRARDAIDTTRRAEAAAVRTARERRKRLAELTDPVERAVMEVKLADAIVTIAKRATARRDAPAIAIEARRVRSDAWDERCVVYCDRDRAKALLVRAVRDVQAASRGRADALAGITPPAHAPD